MRICGGLFWSHDPGDRGTSPTSACSGRSGGGASRDGRGVARLAGEAPSAGRGSLARAVEAAREQAGDPLRGGDRGGALLRLGGQHLPEHRRRARHALVVASSEGQPLGAHEQGPRGTSGSGRPHDGRRKGRHRPGQGRSSLGRSWSRSRTSSCRTTWRLVSTPGPVPERPGTPSRPPPSAPTCCGSSRPSVPRPDASAWRARRTSSRRASAWNPASIDDEAAAMPSPRRERWIA